MNKCQQNIFFMSFVPSGAVFICTENTNKVMCFKRVLVRNACIYLYGISSVPLMWYSKFLKAVHCSLTDSVPRGKVVVFCQSLWWEKALLELLIL